MAQPILDKPLRLAGTAQVLSLPVLWWAATQASQPTYLTAAGLVALAAIGAGLLIARAEPRASLPAARRGAARFGFLIASVYLWGAVGLIVSYYLTDLSWYHAYQYAAYLALPGVVSLLVARRHHRPAADSAIVRELDLGRWLAWLQLALMLAAITYVVVSNEAAAGFAGTTKNWAAVCLMLAGAVALAVISLTAALADRRLRR